jgi:hypothetical protein
VITFFFTNLLLDLQIAEKEERILESESTQVPDQKEEGEKETEQRKEQQEDGL